MQAVARAGSEGRSPAPGTTSSGVDVDPGAHRGCDRGPPGAQRLVGDLAELDLAAHGVAADFEVVVAAGNVMPFLAPSTRREVLQRLRNQVAERGRIVVGFGAGRGYDFGDFLDDARASSLETGPAPRRLGFRPFLDDSDFLVAILRPA